MSMSKSSRAKSYYNSIKVGRKAWKMSQPEECSYCLKKLPWDRLECHEMERRSHAPNRWAHVENYLLLCHECHAGPFAAMNHKRQLAVKLLADPENFSLEGFLAIKPRAPQYVTMREVIEELIELVK